MSKNFTSCPPQKGKKHVFPTAILTSVLITNLFGCVVNAAQPRNNLFIEDKMLINKFRGINGGVLYFDASGHEKNYVTMQTQSGQIWRATPAGYRPGSSDQLTFTDAMYIPRTLRVIWRTGDVRAGRDEKSSDYHKHGFVGGTILGDYTVPVAERIPDDVLDYIRKNGGALRLKIRLKDDGVLVGWDVEERVQFPNWKPGDFVKNYIRHSLPGGDFREAQISGGRVTEPGWQN